MFTAIGNKQPTLLNLLDSANQTKTKTKKTNQQHKHNSENTQEVRSEQTPWVQSWNMTKEDSRTREDSLYMLIPAIKIINFFLMLDIAIVVW